MNTCSSLSWMLRFVCLIVFSSTSRSALSMLARSQPRRCGGVDVVVCVAPVMIDAWNDEGGGGIMSQYVINTDDGVRELLLLHGSDQNAITGSGAITDYDINNLPTSGPAPKPTGNRSEAKAKAQSYKDMSKGQLDSAYDAMRSDPGKAEAEGMKMHNAFFNKPKRVLG